LFDRVQRPTGARFDHVTGDHVFRHVRHYFRVEWHPEDLADTLDTVIGDQLYEHPGRAAVVGPTANVFTSLIFMAAPFFWPFEYGRSQMK
jgi:hypothetical protein